MNFTAAKLSKFGEQPVSLQLGARSWSTAPDNGPEASRRDRFPAFEIGAQRQKRYRRRTRTAQSRSQGDRSALLPPTDAVHFDRILNDFAASSLVEPLIWKRATNRFHALRQ
ncbi:hypothetical protein FHX10_002570 [Rhizobium sp. BK591]|nr:hypothetical protein [Rhizobium sp. BK591]MBB3743077.1 hypothetical protein [Rhizobium sp. BK591]